MKRLLELIVILLPWVARRWVLKRFWGYDIAEGARIGFSYIFPRHLIMGENAWIGHFNVAIHLDTLDCGAHSIIERSNWITGHPLNGGHFVHRSERQPTLILGAHSALTKSHLIDCTDKIEIGAFTTVAGYQSQLITHGIDVDEGRQDCKPIRIGAYCLLGTRVTVLGGAALPNGSVLGAGSVLNKSHQDEYSLYVGQPARRVKAIDSSAAYLNRSRGAVD